MRQDDSLEIREGNREEERKRMGKGEKGRREGEMEREKKRARGGDRGKED